jgi:mannose-6-phosphate isomerase-like protein (cupin superfamily)
MKISRSEAVVHQADPAVRIEALYNEPGFGFDVAIGSLDGHHPRVRNRASDRAYFVLSGSFTIHVGEADHHVSPHDLVVVPKGVPHGLDGKGEYIVITAPRFLPENEDIVAK